ncbi:hypothetical protein CEQ90_04520 [Lewinellaceae bacterium SD302]|nr:hypothetical protein CEQ90_04520 [Lewinellaceae bacterium SD302]
MATIPIFSDTLSKDELEKAIARQSKTDLPLTTLDNPETFRSALSDPTILAAIIQTGGTVLASLITVLVSVYLSRQEAKKAGPGGNIIINLKATATDTRASKIVIPLDDYRPENHQNTVVELDLNPERIADISYVENS